MEQDWLDVYKDFTEDDLVKLDLKYKNLIAKKQKGKFLINVICIVSIIFFISLTAKLIMIFFNQLKFEEFISLGLAIFFVVKIKRDESLVWQYRNSLNAIREELRRRKAS